MRHGACTIARGVEGHGLAFSVVPHFHNVSYTVLGGSLLHVFSMASVCTFKPVHSKVSMKYHWKLIQEQSEHFIYVVVEGHEWCERNLAE